MAWITVGFAIALKITANSNFSANKLKLIFWISRLKNLNKVFTVYP